MGVVRNLLTWCQAEAPENVDRLVATEDNNEELTVEERDDLEKLIELAQRRLARGKAK